MAKILFLLLVFIIGWSETVSAQSFQIETTQIEIAVAPEFNHAGLRVPISGTTAGFNYAGLSVSSDASWITPTVDAATGEVALSFQTANLISSSTGTITVSGNGTTDSFFVKATIAPLNVVKLEDDPSRSRTYGVHQNGVNLGSLIIIDPLTNSKIACVTVGKKPADVAVARDGNELLVINCVDETVTAIDLVSLRVKETIALAQYDNWGVNDTTADIAYGPGSTIYYTDGAWAPALRVFDRTTRQVTQTVLDNTYGFGDFALSPDGKSLVGWWQYGWSAGLANSNITKYSVDAQGKLTFSERTNTTYPTGMMRDPLDSPVLIDVDSKYAFVKQLAVNTNGVTETHRTFPNAVYSISPGGEIAVTDTAIFQTSTGINLLNLPVTTSVQTITSDYARLVYFNKTSRTIGTIDLLSAVGPAVLNRNLSPADGSITLAPQKLEWSPIPGVDRYQVYLGESESEVTNAVATSASYLGEVNTSSIQVTRTLTPGTRYYWRVDAVSQSGVVKGAVYDFTVSLIGTNLTAIQTATVQGHSAHQVAVQLTSTTPQAWQATANQPWVKFASSTGTTPSTLTVILDASQLQKGVHSAQVSIALATGGQNAFTLPVTLEVEPLAITVMESDRTSGLVYAISEDKTEGGTGRAYLLEVDTVAKLLKRVVRVGTSATDLAVHNEDGRVYVTNWRPGSLLALDKTTLEQVRAYGFSPFGGTGYGEGDVYRIAAGAKGRLLVEEQDQWVDISIFDTEKGTKLNDAFVREGGGEFGPGGRFYYHGENNSSGAELIKFDVMGDVFTELASKRVESYSYYGSRTVVVSENGERVFWNGGVLNKDLVIEWLIGKEIYSTTPDGKYAFGEEFIYDIDSKQAVLSMPAKTKVSAFNSTSSKLVVQSGTQLAFFEVKNSMTFPAPVLTLGTVTATSVQLAWTDESLETGFTLQQRTAGSTVWSDVAANLAANVTSYTVTGLMPAMAYEFRIKADSSSISSDWSTVLSATTPSVPVPTVVTSAATGITASGASLNGNVNPNGVMTTVYFEYGLTAEYGSTSSSTSVGQGTASVTVTRTISSLLPATTYHYRIVAVSSGGTVRGSDQTFTTPINQPAVSAGSATNVTSTSATVNGTVNPNGSATTVRFEYGLTTAYGNVTTDASVGSGTASLPATRSLEGLMPGTTYYYRLAATNAGGTSYSTSRSFTTGSVVGAPSAQTTAPSNVEMGSATLSGRINPNGAMTYVRFEFGTNTTYGQSTSETPLSAGSVSVDVSRSVSGLSAGTTYHYRVVARNNEGTTYGLDQVFTTTDETLETLDDEAFTTRRQSVVIDVLANDVGTSPSPLQVVEVGLPSAGSAHINGEGSVTYTPSTAFKGVDTFTYRARSGAGKTSLATVTVRDSFQACAGMYNGLVGTSESGFPRAGVITLKASPLGAFTGTLEFAGKTHRLKGKLRYDGEASVEIRKTGGEPLLVSLRVDPASKRLAGVVAAQGEAIPLAAERVEFDAFNNPAPQTGRYTVLLCRESGSGLPPGYGVATMKVTTSGGVSITGYSESGAPFAGAAYIGSDKRFPLYVMSKSAGKASLHGWVQFRNIAGVSDCDGTVGYSKVPAGESSPVGPSVQLSLIGSRFITPLSGRLLLPWGEGDSNGIFRFGGGALDGTLTPLLVNLTAKHKVTTLGGKQFSMEIDPKTGMFSGKVPHARGAKPASFRGVLFQRQSLGAGFLRARRSSGWVTLEEALPQPAGQTVE